MDSKRYAKAWCTSKSWFKSRCPISVQVLWPDSQTLGKVWFTYKSCKFLRLWDSICSLKSELEKNGKAWCTSRSCLKALRSLYSNGPWKVWCTSKSRFGLKTCDNTKTLLLDCFLRYCGGESIDLMIRIAFWKTHLHRATKICFPIEKGFCKSHFVLCGDERAKHIGPIIILAFEICTITSRRSKLFICG